MEFKTLNVSPCAEVEDGRGGVEKESRDHFHQNFSFVLDFGYTRRMIFANNNKKIPRSFGVYDLNSSVVLGFCVCV